MKSTMRLAATVAFLFCSLYWICCYGATRVQEKPQGWGAEQGEDIPMLDEEQEKSLDSAQQLATHGLIEAADWIDSFFDDERTWAEENTSRATAQLSLGYSKNDQFEIKPRLDIRLKLPRMSERANIFIEAEEDKDFDIESDPLGDRIAKNEDEESDLTAGLRFFLKQTKRFNISLDGGLGSSALFAGVRFRTLQEFGKWDGRFTNRLRYFTDDGWENKASYDLERRLNDTWLFRETTSASLEQDEDGIPHSQYFRLFHVLTFHQAISYELGFYFDTEPSYKMSDTKLLVRYRQRFFRDWLVLEISPRVTFPEDHDREANPGIVVQLEAAFGYNADEEGYRKIFH